MIRGLVWRFVVLAAYSLAMVCLLIVVGVSDARADYGMKGCVVNPGDGVQCANPVPVTMRGTGPFTVDPVHADRYVQSAGGTWYAPVWGVATWHRAADMNGTYAVHVCGATWLPGNDSSCPTYVGQTQDFLPLPSSCPAGQHLDGGSCVPDVVPQTLEQRVAALEQSVVYLQSQQAQVQEPFDPVFAGQVFSFFCAGVLFVFWISSAIGAVVSAVRKF